ncbi:TRAF family member-associated NF-kappa-B activator isoform X1 [Pangasianodon hypophthalmus]|uniref:TRAF family member-associated NF-kappa-B activator isoform X1 n=2 Tax=Pangasianodon hypophthalmus TaxID=310915 RepID=UPI000EFF9DA0|nr:TRAF family member-associated NF-kappa-B activator isoform X1 [Pangasianodon hypophthalmus]
MTHDSCVRDVPEGCGMDRNIGDPLNKAYEAYRNISIENENAKKLLQEKTEQFQRYTQQLEKKIEDQEREISELKAQLNSIKHASGEVKCCETAHRKQETERLSPSIPWPSNSPTSHRTNYTLKESLGCPPMCPRPVPGVSGEKSEDFLDAFQEMQGTFQRIQILTRRQKDHLKRIHKGNDAASAEQQFSMPIQCTDDTGEQVEEPFASSSRPEVDEGLTSGALASHGASPEDGDFMDDIKFPPPTDSEYEFLHSAPDRNVPLPVPRKDLSEPISTVLEESYSSYSVSTPPSHLLPASASHEGVRGPQQPLWSPELIPAIASETSSMGSAHCTFCKATVPNDLMYSHLNSHFQDKAGD